MKINRVVFLVLTLVTFLGGCQVQPASPEIEPLVTTKPYAILYQAGGNSVSSVVANAAYIESLPFDGIVIDSSGSSLTMQTTAISYSSFLNELTPLQNKFTRMDQNFLLVYTQDPGNLFDNAAWNIVIQNFRTLAKAAKAVGLRGIMFDNEAYYTNGDPSKDWTRYPLHYTTATNPRRTLNAYRDQARLRGKQIMQAMVAEYPNITFFGSLHGPYVSEPLTPSSILGDAGVGNASVHELYGPFFAGFVEGAGAQTTVIDGGEIYPDRSTQDFAGSYRWRKFDLASNATNAAFIPDILRGNAWSSKVNVSFGLYTNPNWNGIVMNDSIMKFTLTNALRRSDGYVWIFNENWPWLTPGGMQASWKTAIQQGKAAVGTWPLAAPPAPTTPSVPAGSNLIANPGFENGAASWQGDTGNIVNNVNAAHSGNRAYRGPSVAGETYVSQAVPFQANRTYQLRAWGGNTNLNQEYGTVGVVMTTTGGRRIEEYVSFKTFNYEERVVEFTTPSDINSMTVAVSRPEDSNYDGVSSFYADDLVLKIK